MRLPRIPSERLHVRAKHHTHPCIRRSRIKHAHRPIITARKEHGRLLLIPLHRLHLVLVDAKTPYRSRTLAIPVRIRRRCATEIPQLDSPIGGRGRKHLPVRFIPRKTEHCVDMVRVRRRPRFHLFALLFPSASWDGYMRGRFVGSSKDHVGVHTLDHVQRPYLDLWVERPDSNIVAELGCTIGRHRRGRRRKVEPFEAQRKVGQHQVVVDVQIFLCFIVDVDLELGYLVLSFGGDKDVVGRQYFEVFAFVVLFVLSTL